MNDLPIDVPPTLRWHDYLLLTVFCSLLFGYVAVSGRPMTLHEARLPECAREMMANHNWLIPMNGPRPWLERPPLPHWIMIAVAKVIGQHCDNEWSARIPPALMGLLIVLMVARITAKWFGRRTGLLAGFILATMYEFYYYSTLAEDDIFLAMVVIATMSFWIELEFFKDPRVQIRKLHFLGNRPWMVWGFFILLGLTNLAKGPLVGAAVIVGPLAVYLLLQKDWPRMRRYLWLWGWLIAAAIAISWHLIVQKRFPEYFDNLRYDFHDTSEFNEPFWYYPPQLLGVIMPWTPAAIAGLFVTYRAGWNERTTISPAQAFQPGDVVPYHAAVRKERSPLQRFLWCWAIIPILVLSIPHRKHHHYLVPSLAPWAILAALGARPILGWMFSSKPWTRKPILGIGLVGIPIFILMILLHSFIPGPTQIVVLLALVWLTCVVMFYHGQHNEDGRWVLAAIVIGVGTAYSWGQTYWPNDTIADTQFLHQADTIVPKNELLIVNGVIGPLDFFRVQFYLRADAKLIHNLSYLRGNDIPFHEVWVVSRVKDLPAIEQFGSTALILESEQAHLEPGQSESLSAWIRAKLGLHEQPRHEAGPEDRLALFRLDYRPDLKRYPPPPVSPMQAMMRKPGPICGPPPQ